MSRARGQSTSDRISTLVVIFVCTHIFGLDFDFTSRGVGGDRALPPNGRDGIDPFLHGSQLQTHGFVLRTGVFCVFADEVS